MKTKTTYSGAVVMIVAIGALVLFAVTATILVQPQQLKTSEPSFEYEAAVAEIRGTEYSCKTTCKCTCLVRGSLEVHNYELQNVEWTSCVTTSVELDADALSACGSACYEGRPQDICQESGAGGREKSPLFRKCTRLGTCQLPQQEQN